MLCATAWGKTAEHGWVKIQDSALSTALTPHYAALSYNISIQRKRKGRDKEREKESVPARSLHRYVNEKLRQREKCQSRKSNAAAVLYMTDGWFYSVIKDHTVTTQWTNQIRDKLRLVGCSVDLTLVPAGGLSYH